MENNKESKTVVKPDSTNKNESQTNEYKFGGLAEYSLEKIEQEVLNQSVYLDVFAGSDLAFKENVQKLDNVLSKIENLSAYKFDYNHLYSSHGNDKVDQIGLMAQEVVKTLPELIKTDDNQHMHVNYSKLAALSIAAINELSQKVHQLEFELSEIKKVQ